MGKYTTLAIGEEDPTTKPKSEEEVYTTLAIGEEEPATTEALGEEEPVYTTLAVGEEDGGEPVLADSPFGAF